MAHPPRAPRRRRRAPLEALPRRRRRRARRARRRSPRAGGGFSDDFSTPGHRVPAGVRPARRALPGAVRRHRDASSSRSRTARCATATGPPRSPTPCGAIARPAARHRGGRPARRRRPGLARRADRVHDRPVRPARDGPRQARRASGSRRSSAITRARGHRDRRAAARSSTRPSRPTAPVGELIGLAVAIIVLTLVFRSAAAMLLTLRQRRDRARRRAAAARVRRRASPTSRASRRRSA